MKANIRHFLIKTKQCAGLSLTLLLSACGGEESPSSSPITYKTQMQEFQTFDYVYGGSEMAVVDVKAETALTSKQPLLVDHLFYGSSMRGTREYVFHHSAKKVIDILLYDRNLQQEQEKVEIVADSAHQYWIFAFGNVKKNDYSLYIVEKPNWQRKQDKVMLNIIYAPMAGDNKKLDVLLNGERVATQLPSRWLSPTIPLDDDLSSLAFSVNLPDGETKHCTTISPVHHDEENRVKWKDSNWLLVFTEVERDCHLHPVN